MHTSYKSTASNIAAYVAGREGGDESSDNDKEAPHDDRDLPTPSIGDRCGEEDTFGRSTEARYQS